MHHFWSQFTGQNLSQGSNLIAVEARKCEKAFGEYCLFHIHFPHPVGAPRRQEILGFCLARQGVAWYLVPSKGSEREVFGE